MPLEILSKPGKLTDEEFAAIKRHPSDGRKLLEELGGFPDAVRGLVSDHHERLDGSGYPRGLDGCELCVETRILAVVDVYDALVSDRVYRAAWTPERAFDAARGRVARVRPDACVAALQRAVGSQPPRRSSPTSRPLPGRPPRLPRTPRGHPRHRAPADETASRAARRSRRRPRPGTRTSVVTAITARSLRAPPPGGRRRRRRC